MATIQTMTIEEFAAITEPGRFDLVHGEVIQMPPAGGEHGVITIEIGRLIANYVAERQLGRTYAAETGFIIDHDARTVLAPDVAFVVSERVPPIDQQRGFVPIPPDFAVEVVSPSDRIVDVNAKVGEYLEAGVRLVWIVEPRRRTVTVYRADRSARLLIEGESLDGGDVLPDFSLPVSDIFR